MSSDAEFFAELQKDFLDEATFLLEQCEESYLHLENPDCRPEQLAKIFRLAHSMKGAGAAVGFADLAKFAHEVENCLSILREDPALVSTEIISLLLRCGDAFKVRVEQLKTKSEEPWNIDALHEEVKAAIQVLNSGKPAEVVPLVCESAPTSEAAAEIPALVAGAEPTTTAADAPASNPVPAPTGNAENFFAAMADQTQASVQSQALPQPQATVADVPAKAKEPAKSAQTASSVAPQGSKQNSSVKIDTDRIDSVLDLVGELVVIKSQLMTRTIGYAQDLSLNAVVSLLDKTVRELQDRTLSMRMTPLKSLFLKAQRVIRDLSVSLGKPLDFVMSGEDTEIDRTMVELISDPLLHIVRNAVDHGLEKPAGRKAAGKSEKGTIQVTAQQAGGRVLITIKDDGGGISREKVLKKAVENGLIPASKDLSSIPDSEVFGMIFAPGFSTAEVVSDVSGRGVGLDVVRTNIEKLKGTIDIQSKVGQGTLFTISIPLTTSISDGMMVMVDGYRYIVPMDGIRDLVEFQKQDITRVEEGRFALKLRDRMVPIVSVSDFLRRDKIEGVAPPRKEMAVIVEVGSRRFALRVDSVVGQDQVVVKSLGESFKNTQGVAGAAILGDGMVALVLDVDGISKWMANVRGSNQGLSVA